MEFIGTAAAEARGRGLEMLAVEYEEMGELYNRKLWHELTMKAVSFVGSDLGHAENCLPFLDNFVSKFEARMNQLRYAELLCAIVVNAARANYLKIEDAIVILDLVLENKKSRLGTEASIVVDMEAVLLRLLIPEISSTKKKLEETKIAIDSLTGTTDTTVFESYYRASAAYYKIAGPPEAFYRTALALLSYSVGHLRTQEETETLAVDVALAALTGDGVYNFGEVIATPILKNLDSSANFSWLAQLLRIFHQSDVSAFVSFCETHQEQFASQPALVARLDFLKEKIALLALMDPLFQTPSHARTLPFQLIAIRLQLPLDAVEWLAMRAMALGLVRGKIDQVNATIHFDWVQPRVLDHSQINHLILQLDAVSDKSKSAFSLLADHTVDLI